MIKKRFKFILFTLIIVCVGYYAFTNHYLNHHPADTQTAKKPNDTESSSLTLSERIEKRSLAIKESQKEHQTKEQEFIDAQNKQTPTAPYKDLSLKKDDIDNTQQQYDNPPQNEDRLQVIVEELKRPFFENPDEEDLNNSIRRRLANREWLEENLQNTNKVEKQNFIKRFVQIAKEQGYRVHFPQKRMEGYFRTYRRCTKK